MAQPIESSPGSWRMLQGAGMESWSPPGGHGLLALVSEDKSLASEVLPLVLIPLALCALFLMLAEFALWIIVDFVNMVM